MLRYNIMCLTGVLKMKKVLLLKKNKNIPLTNTSHHKGNRGNYYLTVERKVHLSKFPSSLDCFVSLSSIF